MINIPLQDVRMIWDANPPESEPCVKVYCNVEDDDDRYTSSWDFATGRADRDGKIASVQLLLEMFVHLAVLEKINPQEIHATFMAVREYRAAMKQAGTVNPSA